MANVYVRSSAAGAGTGADWANAYTTLAAALTAKATGDDFWVSEDHAETSGSQITLTSPGTAASPCRIICVNHAGSVPPVSADLATTATVTTTAASNISLNGYAYCYGVALNCGTAGTGNANIQFGGASTAWWWRMEACALKIPHTGSGDSIFVGATSSPDSQLLELINTTVQFGATSHGITVLGRLIWRNTASAITGATLPTTLFLGRANAVQGIVGVSGVDLSALGSGKNLVTASTDTVAEYFFQNCKLGSSVSVTTGSVAGQGGVAVRLINCDSANTNYRYYRQTFQGTITQETTIVRSGGASDGTTPISRKMVTTANSKFYSPLESDPIVFWNESTSAVTVTVPIITDNVTLKNNEAWIEVEYPGNASFPISTFNLSDRAADVLNAGSNQATDGTSSWTTTGLGTPVKQSLTATFTPAAKGIIRVKVCLAKASTTMYFDPTVGISSAAQYMLGEGFINDPDDPTQSAVTSGTKYNQNRSTGSASAARVLESASLNGGLI